MALEMVLNIEIFKSEDTGDKSTLVPLVFPLIAGAGAFTTLISLKSQYATPNIILAVLANIVVIYFVIAFTGKFKFCLLQYLKVVGTLCCIDVSFRD